MFKNGFFGFMLHIVQLLSSCCQSHYIFNREHLYFCLCFVFHFLYLLPWHSNPANLIRNILPAVLGCTLHFCHPLIAYITPSHLHFLYCVLLCSLRSFVRSFLPSFHGSLIQSSHTHSRDYAKPWLAHSKTPTPTKCYCCPDISDTIAGHEVTHSPHLPPCVCPTQTPAEGTKTLPHNSSINA